MSKKSVSVPRSTAANAYELLNDVARVITEEPGRVNMKWWAFLFKGRTLSSQAQFLEAEKIPQCGTVGCIAGWCCFLTRDTEEYAYGGPRQNGFEMNKAEQLLGIYGVASELFSPDLPGKDGMVRHKHGYNYGTREYARAVVRKISERIRSSTRHSCWRRPSRRTA